MARQRSAEQIPEEKRKEIFKDLVEAQDQEMTVAQSRQLISQRHSVTEADVQQIEREGIEEQWPPL